MPSPLKRNDQVGKDEGLRHARADRHRTVAALPRVPMSRALRTAGRTELPAAREPAAPGYVRRRPLQFPDLDVIEARDANHVSETC